jgi:hypothetical protein
MFFGDDKFIIMTLGGKFGGKGDRLIEDMRSREQRGRGRERTRIVNGGVVGQNKIKQKTTAKEKRMLCDNTNEIRQISRG